LDEEWMNFESGRASGHSHPKHFSPMSPPNPLITVTVGILKNFHYVDVYAIINTLLLVLVLVLFFS